MRRACNRIHNRRAAPVGTAPIYAEKASFGKGGGIREADDGGLYFAAGEMCAANEVCANLVYFVHFASQNTIPTRLRREPLCQRGLKAAKAETATLHGDGFLIL